MKKPDTTPLYGEARSGTHGPMGRGPGPMGRGPGPMGHGPGGPLGMPGEKPKDAKATLAKLARLLKPSLVPLSVVLLAAVLSTFFSVLSPAILGRGTDLLFAAFKSGTGLDAPAFYRILATLLALYLLSALFAYIQQHLITGVSQRLVYTLRRDLYAKINRLPLAWFDGRSQGEVLSRVSNDVDTISGTLQQGITQLVSALITVLGTLVMMLLMSPLLTLIAIASLPLAALLTGGIARRSRGHFKAQQAALGEISGRVEENIGGHLVVMAFGQEEKSMQDFAEANERLCQSAWRAQFISGLLWPLMMLINNAGYVLVSVAGGLLASRGTMSIGSIQAFLQYLRHFTQPIIQLAQIFNVIQSTMAAAERVFEVLEETEESKDIPADSSTRPAVSGEPTRGAPMRPGTASLGEVRFKAVSFSYTKDRPLITGLDLDVKPGSVVAIVGPTGAGKTTLVNLLMRFYDIDSGSIELDGCDIRSMSRQALRSRTGMVLQDTWLFKGSIRDNIAWGREGSSDEDIAQAARLARADHFIQTLPEGWDTVLNEEADNLSAGQKQLITIARALLADPSVLILDEATSSVDTRTERLIQEGLRSLMKDRTNFVIAHRLSTIRDADLILVMEEGRIVEQGTHSALLARGEHYHELYKRQFSAPLLDGEEGKEEAAEREQK